MLVADGGAEHERGPRGRARHLYVHAVREHPLAVPEVNALAEWMHRWVQEESAVAELVELTACEILVLPAAKTTRP